MKSFCNNSIIAVIFPIAILTLSFWVHVSLARTHPHPPAASSSLDQKMSSSSSSSSQALSHSIKGPSSAHVPAMAAASLRRIPPSRSNPTQNKLTPRIRG